MKLIDSIKSQMSRILGVSFESVETEAELSERLEGIDSVSETLSSASTLQSSISQLTERFDIIESQMKEMRSDFESQLSTIDSTITNVSSESKKANDASNALIAELANKQLTVVSKTKDVGESIGFIEDTKVVKSNRAEYYPKYN